MASRAGAGRGSEAVSIILPDDVVRRNRAGPEDLNHCLEPSISVDAHEPLGARYSSRQDGRAPLLPGSDLMPSEPLTNVGRAAPNLAAVSASAGPDSVSIRGMSLVAREDEVDSVFKNLVDPRGFEPLTF